MEKVKTWLEEKAFWLKTGAKLEIANDGDAVQEIVIRYKDYYFGIMLDAGTGEPTGDFGWSTDPGMFPSTPIREYMIAKPPTKKSSQNNG